MLHPKKILILLLIIVFPVFMVSILLTITGAITTSYSGFAVDSYERIYVGTESEIEVYDKGLLLKTISPKTSRGYAFTIQEDNTILLSTSTTVYVMDLDGNVINEYDDVGTKTFNMLQREKKTYVAENGSTYYLKNKMGRIEIVNDNNDVLYKMPILDYIIKLLLFFSSVIAVIFIPIIIWRWRKSA